MEKYQIEKSGDGGGWERQREAQERQFRDSSAFADDNVVG
jgi:hypothetical protein